MTHEEVQDADRAELRRELRRRFGSRVLIEAWLSTPLPDFGGQTPLEVIEGLPDGARTMLAYLRLSGG